MKKRILVVGNWKMHLNASQSSLLAARLDKHIEEHKNVEVVLAPSMLAVQPLSTQINRRKFRLAAQNAYSKDEGAFTGEVAFTQLQDLVHYVIIGHSERRVYFHETLDEIRDKVASCVRNGMTPILCVGETTTEKRAGETKQVLHDQITTALSNLTGPEVANIVLVYEPQWTISSFQGRPAKPDEAQKAMDYIRQQVKGLYGDKVAEHVRVIYGGSVDEHMVRAYLDIDGCEGVLIGSASLNYHKFSSIVKVAHEVGKEKYGSKKD